MNKSIENGQETNAAELTTTANGKKTYCLPLKVKLIFEHEVFALVEAESEDDAEEMFKNEEFLDFIDEKHPADNIYGYNFYRDYDVDYCNISEINKEEDVDWDNDWVDESNDGRFNLFAY